MKKISNFCMLLLLLCTTFFVFNVNYTREVVRIQEMGKTASSLDVYLKDVNEPAASVLRFFEDVSKEYKVSIIKTDSGDEVIKSGVFDKDTFPYQEFGLSSLDFARVRKLWLNTSSVRIPKWSGNNSLKTVRSISATNSSLMPNLVSSNGLIPITRSFILGSSRTKSSSRSSGNLSKTSRIKSPFGSITTAECPFLMTCKIRLSIMVDLPAPVLAFHSDWW